MNRPGRIRQSVLWFLFAVVFAVLLGAPQEASAQPVLNFKRIINNWPTIELYFTVACDGQPEYSFNKEQNFEVYEDGIKVGDFTLWCPDPRQRCAISVSLVFDASGSMSGQGNAGAKAAGIAFVDLMDGVIDEAAIIWFTSAVNIEIGMTTSLNDLKDAVNSLPASGATAVWDGIYTGLEELINSGSNPCRAVIAMTDGGDNSSSRTPQEIIALANRNRIRVFTIGLGSGIQAGVLETIATLTGGRYYQTPNATQLAAIYQEISTIIFAGFLECVITYQAICQDGGLRTVDLSLINFCGGSDTRTKSYRAPKDTSTYLPLEISLGKRTGRGGTEVKVPLDLNTYITPKSNFYPATFTIMFDPNCAQFVNIETQGTLFDGVPITIEPIAGGISFTTEERIQVEGNGTLAELTFELSDPDDTTCCDLKLASWVFTAGCFKPVLKDGELCIIPRAPIADCNISMPPELVWVRSAKDYSPNPFTVTGRTVNSGDKEARNVQFKINYDPADFQLVSPFSDLQNGTPIDCAPGSISEAQWSVRALPRLTGDSVEICMTIMFDNHPDVECCKKVWIPPTEPILECSIDGPVIVANNDDQRYDPMPFELTVNVLNRGGMKSGDITATIIVPPDLSLAGPDEPNNNTKNVTPLQLLPNQTGRVSWWVKHPITIVEKEYTVRVWVKTSNADSSYCEYLVKIPPLEAPSIQASCVTPTELIFNENLDTYQPNPFTVKLTAVNLGAMPANNVTAFMYLPENVELVDAAEPLRKSFGTLNEWRVGDPVPELTWEVRYTKKLRYDTKLEFKWVVGGVGPTGIPTDSVTAYCEIDVPGLKPSFACEIIAPDSLVLNASETDVEPNPFEYKYRIWNTSNQVATIKYVEIYYPNDGITLDPATPKRQNIDVTLNPKEETIVTWRFNVVNRITRRLIQIQAVAIDDENNPIACQKQIPIQALKTALTCATTSDETIIRYDQITQSYTNDKWVVTTEMFNTGGFVLSDVTAEVEVYDPSGLDLVEFDGDFGANTNPHVEPFIFEGQSRTAQWGFKLKNPNTTGVSQYIEFKVHLSSNETPRVEDACNVVIEIRPVLTPKLVCSLEAPDSILFVTDHYEPSPFDLKLRVENIGNGDAQNVTAYVLQDARFTISPPSPSVRSLGLLPAFTTNDYGDNDGFILRVNPKDVDGYDYIQVVVVADGIPEALCEIPVFVQAEQRPVFQMNCEAIPDTLAFNETINDYQPNPFIVNTTATNIGTTLAKDCQFVFVGPPRFTPHDKVSIRPIVNNGGVMMVGDKETMTWNLRALLRDIGGTDTMIFQIQGKGGMGERLVIGECRVPIFVPPARAAEYELTCSSPPALTFDNANGIYIPDPFTFEVKVKNIGEALGQDIVVTPNLSPAVSLAIGETSDKFIPTLNPGDEVTLTWLVSPIRSTGPTTGDTAKLCASATDKFGKSADCCSKTWIPPATAATLTLTCWPQFDSLTVDKQRGDYMVNPFTVFLNITNNSERSADSIVAQLIPLSQDLRLLDAPQRYIADKLNPGESIAIPAEWLVNAIPRTQTGDVYLQFLVRAKGLGLFECTVKIYIPEIGRPTLDCNITSSIDDGIVNFIETEGDYEGTQSAHGKYNIFTVRVNVQNIGEAQANRVRVVITPIGDGATLDDDESAIKSLDPGDIIVNGTVSQEWNMRPLRRGADQVQRFEVKVTADNASPTICYYDLVIEGAPKLVDVTLPNDAVGQYGDKIAVPIYVTSTVGRDASVYKLNVQFDPSVVRFVSATNENTQTQFGWNGPRTQLFKSNAGLENEDVVRVEDFTTGSPLSSKTDGVLVYLLFEAIYGGNDNTKLDYATSELNFIEDLDIDGKSYKSSMNSLNDGEYGDITLNLNDGLVTVSGECIVPLNSSLKFQLAQNKPNPFNPSTVIEYSVGFDTHVKLVVYDAVGKHVKTLVDEFQTAGDHRVVFNASELPSGTYLYKIETPRFTEMKRMVLTR